LATSVVGDSGLELWPSSEGASRSGRNLRIVKDGSEMKRSSERKLTSGKLNVTDMISDLGVFETKVASGRPGEAGDPRWIQGLIAILIKILDNLNTCHHRDRVKILTTTLYFPSLYFPCHCLLEPIMDTYSLKSDTMPLTMNRVISPSSINFRIGALILN